LTHRAGIGTPKPARSAGRIAEVSELICSQELTKGQAWYKQKFSLTRQPDNSLNPLQHQRNCSPSNRQTLTI